jgi:DNA-binding protein H-NS
MARRKQKMADNPDTDDIEEGRLPPSDITRLGSGRNTDLEEMSTEELLTLIEDAMDKLPVEELLTIRDLAEQKRQEHLEEVKASVLEEFQARLQSLGLSMSDVLPQSAQTGGRRMRADAGKPLPVRYRGPNGETWSGRGHPPRGHRRVCSESYAKDSHAQTNVYASAR